MNLKLNINLLNKVIAILISVFFFTTSVCMNAIAVAVMPDLKVSDYKQIFDDFILPYSYGKITKSHFAGTDRVVINIQDLHCHPQVQNNISNIIELFDKKYGVTNIYLEGACGDISTKWLTKNLRDNNKKEILNNILKTGRLTGAEYYSAISDKTEIIKGLEKEEPYSENLKRFGYLLEKQNEIKLILESVEKETEKIKKQYYKKGQYKLEKLFKKYEQGKINTDKYYVLLSKYIDKLGIKLEKYENISKYVTLLKLQKQFNRKTVQRELTSLLPILKQNLSYQMYSMLLSKTDNFKKADILADYIMQILQNYNINFTDNFSQLYKYFQFVQINKNINPVQLFKEQEKLAMEINMMFCENEFQREIVFLVNFEKYLKQYLMTKVTLDDYEYYKENIDIYIELYDKYIDNKTLTLLKPYMEETDKFYEININRNEYFSENIFNGIETNKLEEIKEGKDEINKIINNMHNIRRVDVIVTGGFHSQTVTDMLQKKSVNYIVITPNVSGGVEEAENTYYEIAKQQKEIDFQTLATFPLSSYNKTNYRTAVAIKAFPKEAEILFGKEEVERVKTLIEKSYINIKDEDIQNIKKYKEELEKDIDISKILESDDIEIEDLKSLIKNISAFIFDVEDLSEQELFDISKGVIELINNKDFSLVMKFFNNLKFRQDFIFFRIFQADKTRNIKNAMKKYLELTNYDFYALQEIFDGSNIKGTKLKKLLVLLLEKDSKGNYKNKNFIEENVSFFIALCSNYKQDDLEMLLNIVFKDEYNEFINNNSDIMTEIIKQKYVPQDFLEILNFLLKKDKGDIDFIDKHSQQYNFYGKVAIATIIKQGYDVEYLEQILNKLLKKDKHDNYIYDRFLSMSSTSLTRYLAIYSPVSQEMLDLLIEYENVVDNDFDLISGLFEGLEQLPSKEKQHVCDKLVNILEKYCKNNNFINQDILQMRNFLINNISPDTSTSKIFVDLIISELKNFQKQALNEEDFINKNRLVEFVINNINALEYLGFSEELVSLLIDDLKMLQRAPLDKSAIECEDTLLSFLIENYNKLNVEQKKAFSIILNNYIYDFINLTDNYNDEEISQYSHHSKSFFGMVVTDKGLEKLNKQQEYEKLQEEKEIQLTKRTKSIINNKDKFDVNISADKLKILEKKLNIISKERDFERLNDKVKKMFMEEYIEYPVTLKEYSVDTSIETKIRTGKNPPLKRDIEVAKQRNCNDAEQVKNLFVSFVANNENINYENNKMFKELTGFTIDEIRQNENMIDGAESRIVINESKEIYERDYELGEIVKIYADDIVYAIARIMKQQDEEQNKIENENFNNLLKKNEIEYNFKCPLFDGPCLIPYSEILNAGYDIGDCTGDLADGLNNVDFRNNRIYTQNHFITGYYKDGILIQKYGCHFDKTDLHIFSLEDIIDFRPGTSKDGDYGGENPNLDIDSEGVYFFKSMDFIVSDFIGKVNNDDIYYKHYKVENIYIETDASNSYYLKDIASSITNDEYSNNDNLLYQNQPQKLKKLKPDINLKEKIEEQKKIAQRSRILRPILNYKIIPKNKFEDENDIAYNKIKNNKFTVKTDSYAYYYFVDKFIEVFEELLSLYKKEDMFAIPINKKEMLEIKVENRKIAETINNASKNTSKFTKITNKERIDKFNKMPGLKTQYLKSYTNLESILNIYKTNNVKFFGKNNKIKDENIEIEVIEIKEDNNDSKVVVRITDTQEHNVYYAEVDIKISIKPELNIKTTKLDKNIINKDNKTEDKKELLNMMELREIKFKNTLAKELQNAYEIVIEFPSIKKEKDKSKKLKTYMESKQDVLSLIINKEQLTTNLINWAKDNNIKLLVIENNPLNIRRGRRIINTNMRYIGKNNYIFIFSKEGIRELNVLNEELKKQFGNIEVLYEYNEEKGIITTDSGKEYNIITNDNLDISAIKENIKQTDLIKDLLSAA